LCYGWFFRVMPKTMVVGNAGNMPVVLVI